MELSKNALKRAYMLTIFGYSAPQSDVEAIALMKEAWGQSTQRNLEEIEIIDVKSEEDLVSAWQDFIHTHHYKTYKSFYDSWISRHPRRTCEATWNRLMECEFLQDNPVPRHRGFDELLAWYAPLIAAEAVGANNRGT